MQSLMLSPAPPNQELLTVLASLEMASYNQESPHQHEPGNLPGGPWPPKDRNLP